MNASSGSVFPRRKLGGDTSAVLLQIPLGEDGPCAAYVFPVEEVDWGADVESFGFSLTFLSRADEPPACGSRDQRALLLVGMVGIP
mmetsp:Transcript_131571/g.262552  ORF Transcript_131571/g.262552 Transcript_131571/m.262552 type:complete len:86 (-) Transcript_131571:1072-1329(-)